MGDVFEIDISNPIDTEGFTYNGGMITFNKEANGNDYVITGTSTTNRITVPSGVNTKISLNNVDITNISNIITIETGATLNVEVLSGTVNTLICTATTTTSNSTPINVPLGANLFMYGSGSLKVQGGSYNAGIGSGNTIDSGYIYIKDTTIETIGGIFSPGIGAAILATNDFIKISGNAVITGSGGINSALIGGGSTGGGGKIVISDNVSVIGFGGGPDGGSGIGKGLNGGEVALSIGNQSKISLSAYNYGAFKDDDTINAIINTNILNVQLDAALSTTLERIVKVKDSLGNDIGVSNIVVPKSYKYIGCTTPGYSGELTIEVYDESGTIFLGNIVNLDDTKVNTKNDFSLTNVKFLNLFGRERKTIVHS